ncbi:hypothetical protein MRX96_012982 [Rhipicephalus microplus]
MFTFDLLRLTKRYNGHIFHETLRVPERRSTERTAVMSSESPSSLSRERVKAGAGGSQPTRTVDQLFRNRGAHAPVHKTKKPPCRVTTASPFLPPGQRPTEQLQQCGEGVSGEKHGPLYRPTCADYTNGDHARLLKSQNASRTSSRRAIARC